MPERVTSAETTSRGLTVPSALSSRRFKAESSLWQFTPLPCLPPYLPLSTVLWGSRSYSPLPGPSMSKHEWVQSKLAPPPSNTHLFYFFSFPPFKFSLSLWCTGPIPSAWLAFTDKWKSQRSYWQKMESEEDFRNVYPTAISVLSSRMKTPSTSSPWYTIKTVESMFTKKFKGGGGLEKRFAVWWIFFDFLR